MTSDTGAPVPLLTPVTRVAIASVGAYVGAQVIADVTSLQIGSVTGRAVDLGTFIYPITFTLRDLVHKALGRRAARTLVITAALRSEEHPSELQSLMRNSYAVFCLKNTNATTPHETLVPPFD